MATNIPPPKTPVRVHVFVIRLADLKAKLDANHENTHPINDWSCRLCNQHRDHVTPRGTGFKRDTTRTNLARPGITGLSATWPRITVAKFR